MRNKRGPKMDPCGTPDNISIEEEKVELILTHCLRPDKYEDSQHNILPLTPICSSLLIKILWSKVSKAFERSKKTEIEILPEFKDS